jgi:hypothetical protein
VRRLHTATAGLEDDAARTMWEQRGMWMQQEYTPPLPSLLAYHDAFEGREPLETDVDETCSVRCG